MKLSPSKFECYVIYATAKYNAQIASGNTLKIWVLKEALKQTVEEEINPAQKRYYTPKVIMLSHFHRYRLSKA